jgi:biopolymer transport protein ExbD
VQPSGWDLGGASYSPLIVRKNLHEDAEFDITAMIDLVFMMNIYFLVTFLTVALGEVDLPSAKNVTPLDPDTAVMFTVLAGLNDESVTVNLADRPESEQISDDEEQDQAIHAAVEQGAAAGKTAVLIKAEKHVSLRQLFRLMSAATVEGMKIHVGVLELDKPS